ncbi:hypothetical protein K450DRAFT_281603 [Umbelopsis ramanniana AG]|uniref:Uncharacterized protein n=1 Tax=Umbelopsis ramanniana AG TaxID=1314678 RepID=A0AAD5E6U4_UMBRA|nr:uncharacterized protein K450DRAFT_281603 [Umbelopsis ramanniana AG]KAI8578548.1 hypothetical protein K450DRAFT_281603 [Umbelopsis ramanniana AG]
MKFFASLSVVVLSVSVVVAEVAKENVSGNSVASEKQENVQHQQLWASDDHGEKDEKKDKDDGSDHGNFNGCADGDCQGSVDRALAHAMVPFVINTFTSSVPCASGTINFNSLLPTASAIVQVGTGVGAKTATVKCGGSSATVLNPSDVCPTPTSVVKTITVSGQLVTITLPVAETIVQTQINTVTGAGQTVTQTSTVTSTQPCPSTKAACPRKGTDIYVRCDMPIVDIAKNAEGNAYLADEFARQAVEDGCFMVTEWRSDGTSPSVFYRVDVTKPGAVSAYRSACESHGTFRCSESFSASDDISCPA